MKFIFAILLLALFTACTGEVEQVEPEKPIQQGHSMTRDDMKRHIESQLQIPVTEKYGIEFFEDHLNDDDTIDVIIAVNLLERAKNEAIKSNRLAKRAEMDFMGNYNCFFFYDGATGTITSPIMVPSSPLAPLTISFNNVTSELHKDVQIDFRIGDSKFRAYYTIASRAPFQVCQSEIFLDYNTDNRTAFSISLEENPQSFAKNIVVYKGDIEELEMKDQDEIYQTEPKIIPTAELVRRWYYSPQHMKYYLKKDEM